MSDPMLFEIHDLKIEAGEDLAFAHYLVRCGATGRDGQEHRTWLRATTCLRRIDGDWKVVHGHCSAPFDPQAAKRCSTSQPEPPSS